ncbi:MAG: TlpA disulfide reductase family protein [Verrucomicrobiota bacterium]
MKIPQSSVGFTTLVLANVLVFALSSWSAEPAPATEDEKAVCEQNLKQIHQAIQAYRRDQKELPDWLSHLVPEHLADTNVFLCPVSQRSGRSQTFGIEDPDLKLSYIYEFCVQPLPQLIWGGSPLRMQDWKRLQMATLGGKVPMVRCLNHGTRALNISFDGEFYESPVTWESLFANVVNESDLSPQALMQKFHVTIEGTPAVNAPSIAPPSVAFSRIQRAEDELYALLGKPAPDFELELLSGGKFKLSDHRDKVIILDFWATWCGPCRMAMPVLAELAKKYQDKGVQYFAVDLRETPEKVQQYLTQEKLSIAVPLDRTGEVGKAYQVRGIPTMVLIDQAGVVRECHVGFNPNLRELFQTKLDALVKRGD